MRIERIDENKIKVTLSLNDLQERAIDLDALSYNSPQARQLFQDMMYLAKAEYGFDADDNSQLFIEAVPTPPEGFEIIVTKVEEDREFESIHKYIKSKLKKSDITSRKRSKKIVTNVFVYQFASFEDLCQGVKHADPLIGGEASLYKYEQNYYLVVPKSLNGPEGEPIEISLNEFGEKMSNSAFFEGYLNEHAERLIEDDAINVIKSYF